MPKPLMFPEVKIKKRQVRVQAYDIATIDGRVRPQVDLPVGHRCAVEEVSGHAYLVAEANQYLNENGIWVQTTGETSCLPDMTAEPNEIEDVDGVIDKIYRDSKEQEKQEIFRNVGRADILTRLLWLIGIPVTGFVLMYGLHILKG
jgi:hypothetical protein